MVAVVVLQPELGEQELAAEVVGQTVLPQTERLGQQILVVEVVAVVTPPALATAMAEMADLGS